MTRWCSRCDVAPVHADGECHTCYMYRRRTGKARPLELIRRAIERADERRFAA